MEILKSTAGLMKAGPGCTPGEWIGPIYPAPGRGGNVTGFALAFVVAVATSLALLGQAHAQAANEYQVKAAFLYNFAKFVEWPHETFADGGVPFIVAVVGDDPFGSFLDQTINGRTVNGRQLTVKRLKWGQNLRECHILFISSSEQRRLGQILESLKGAGVLTVGEMGRFAQQGGIINFTMEENKVRFDVNTAAAEQARLKISSKLLTLAKSVIGEHRMGRN